MNAIMTIAERRRTRSFGLTEELAKGGFAKPAHISIAGNRFTLVSAQGDKTPWQSLALDIVICGSNPAPLRLYFDPTRPYDPEEQEPPLCSSDDGVGPRPGVPQPQAATCAECAMKGGPGAWGTGRNGGKACGEYKRLAVVVVGDPNPLAGYMLGIKGGSHKALRDYAQFVASLPAQGGVKPELENVVTRVEFEGQGVLKFTAVGWPDQQTEAKIDKLASMGLLDQVVGLTPTVTQELPAPVMQPQAFAAIQREQERRAPQPMVQTPPANWGAPQPGMVTDAFHQLGGQPAQQNSFSSAPAAFGAPHSSDEKPKRHRRTKAEIEADAARAAQKSNDPLYTGPRHHAEPTPQFGMVPSENAPRPDAALSAAINDVLGLPVEE